jgi:(1->4)-alpha-D-glucan 1-alpha-D-glucosylmutase
VELAHRVQQYTGPVEAKGVEDTAFYRDVALLSTNEAGGDLRQPACSPEAFHEASARRLARWPFAMLATATHDTKRGEDVRARLNVISEVPDRWRRAVSAWARLNAGHRVLVDGSPAPDRQDEYLFYQTVAGVWPAERLDEPLPAAAPDDLVRRLSAYMLKAVREAKRHTSWVSPDAAYEAAVERFVEAVLRGSTARRFLSQFVPFQRRLGFFGAVNSLAQVVIKVAAPGVPDIYQGCELWDLNLVDPDNRRPVDFGHRAACLAELLPLLHEVERALGGAGEVGPAVADRLAWLRAAWPDERAKLWTTLGALRLRRARPELFLLGACRPLPSADGSPRLLAFAREWEDQAVVAVVPRLGAAAAWDAPALPIGRGMWGDMRMAVPAAFASRQVVNALTGASVPVARDGDMVWMAVGDALASWPVALLVAC